MREEIIAEGGGGRRSAKREGNRKRSGPRRVDPPVGAFDPRFSLD